MNPAAIGKKRKRRRRNGHSGIAHLAEHAAMHLAAIVESSDDAIISKDLRGTVTSWNKAAERIFGYTADEIIGRSITTIIPPELRADEPVILAKITAGERIEHFETIRVAKDGRRLNVALTVSPVRNAKGRIVGAAKIARDVTRQKEIEQALHMTERLAAVGRLAATVAHEINNPLEAVTNLIYLAKRDQGLPDQARKYLELADRELARVAHIAQQTLGFYRDTTRPGRLEVARLIQDVMAIYDRKLRDKSLVVTIDVEPGLAVHASQGEVKQVLSNLVANAIDASRRGGRLIVRGHALHGVKARPEMAQITVADTGIGIPKANQPQIFKPFFTTKTEGGTGLGLWITRDLIEKNGGRLRFRSRAGKRSGTVMGVFLPTQPRPTSNRLAA